MSDLRTFEGGIHPPDLKETSHLPIVSLPLPRKVVLPVSQHIGAPAVPKVIVGENVVRGQLIADAGGFVSAPVHATISGKVQAIGNFLHPFGIPSLSIVIEAQENASETVFELNEGALELPPDQMKKRIQEAGIVGLGGAAFPTIVKLSPPPQKPIDFVILNGVECEPALTSDHRVMIERTEKVFLGLKIIMKILGAKKGIIGIEANKPDAIKIFQEKVNGVEGLEVFPLEVKYPQGGEKQLIFSCIGREVPSGGLPMDVGVVVQNVVTASAIYDAVFLKMPLLDKVVTLAGKCINRPGNYQTKIGTLVSELVESAGGLNPEFPLKKIIMGGPMMGPALFDLNVPVIKGTSGILFWDESQAEEAKETVCIKCGRCIRGCPMKLMPQKIKNNIDFNRWVQVEEEGVLDCIECGTCSYMCPGRLPLVQSFKLGKKIVSGIRRRQADELKKKQEKKANE